MAPVRSNRDLLSSARGATIFSGVLMAAFLGGVGYQHAIASADTVDVAASALSDRQANPDGTVVRVQGDVRRETIATTNRGHALLALAGVPDVIVSCDAVQTECADGEPVSRTLTGVLEPVTDAHDEQLLAKFAKDTLGLEREKVRVLNLRVDAGARGAGVRLIVFEVLAGVFALFALMGLVRIRVLGARIRREEG